MYHSHKNQTMRPPKPTRFRLSGFSVHCYSRPSKYFDERQREQVANRLVHRLEHLGYTVEVAFTPAPAPAASG
jgi:hypothetical protein